MPLISIIMAQSDTLPNCRKHPMSNPTDKYDRQLRLWKNSGQSKLANSKVALFGANTLGSEVLKNLVLPGITLQSFFFFFGSRNSPSSLFLIFSPILLVLIPFSNVQFQFLFLLGIGIGQFFLFDSAKVSSQDCQSNFFLSKSDIGSPISEAVVSSLKELNPQVLGFHKNVEDVQFTADYFKKFSLVILCNQPFPLLSKIIDCCWDSNIPVLYCIANGFISSLKIFVSEHCVVESHSDTIDDLRIAKPFHEIETFASLHYKTQTDSKSRSEIPYPIILIKKLQEFAANNNGKLPVSFQEKKSFKNFLISDPYYAGNENFDEAVENSIRCCSTQPLNSELQNIFDNPNCSLFVSNPPKNNNISFWALSAALKQFYADKDQGNYSLPLNDSISDMHSSTILYTQILSIYRNKFIADARSVHSNLTKILSQASLNLDISNSETELFCRNARNLRVISTPKPQFIPISLLSNPNPGSISSSLSILVPQFHEFGLPEAFVYSLYAFQSLMPSGPTSTPTPTPTHLVYNLISQLLNPNIIKIDLSNKTSATSISPNDHGFVSKVSDEICKSNGYQVHVTCAAMGGIAAQEAIKLITQQYIPSDKTILYDGIHGSIHTI
ncbi:NEDD8-activating enzyme E1 regulatory subunit [Smittium mucronatum]|uniref:NEDD8-activating enzyme E1 regulatory subunit n=1 Tax=Smittium mucronatum TaxID=133383 RepID=A0A1R0GY68_9FUNG|nr:NEDD8-activating enzyme E1 regulatory subunit [Smittium mucronatum]